MNGKIRVFISYSHEDRESVGKIVKVLEENGLAPMWDRGCSIIITALLNFDVYGPQARPARLKELVEFLDSKSMADANVIVAFAGGDLGQEGITIVGDWFVAQSVSATIGRGIRQTIFTRHAPSIRTKIELFDESWIIFSGNRKFLHMNQGRSR